MESPNHPRRTQDTSKFPTPCGKKRIAALTIAAAAVFLPQVSPAAIWDITPGDGSAITPGSGSWTLGGPNWNDTTDSLNWSNGFFATFAGADAVAPDFYNISVGSGISTSLISFQNSGYLLNADTPTSLRLTADPSVEVFEGKSATIGSNLTVYRETGGLTITGGGLLTLEGTVQNTGANLAITGGATVEVKPGGQLLAGASFVLGPTSGTGTNGTLIVSGGTVRTVNNNNNGNFVLGNVDGVNAEVTITAGLIALAPDSANGLRFGPTGTVPNATITGVFNLDGGELETRRISEGPAPEAGSVTSTFNFNGGLLRVNGTPPSAGSGGFMSGLDFAIVKERGAHIDTNGFNATVGQVLSHDPDLQTTPDGGLTKTGEGILALSGANTFTGAVKVLGGVLSISSLPSTGNTPNALGLSSNDPSNLILDGGTFRFTGGANTGTSRGFTIGAKGATIEVAHSNSNLGFRFGGVVTGDGELTITKGANTGLFLAFSGANTYTGKTIVKDGAIFEYRSGASPGLGGSFASGTEVLGATLRLDPAATSGANKAQTFTEYFTLGEGAVLENRTFNNTISGQVALSGNASVISQVENAGSLILGGEVMVNEHTLTLSPNLSGFLVSEVSSGTQGTLVKAGDGPVVLSVDSDRFEGTIRVDAGTLNVAGAFPEASALKITGGVLELAAADRINDGASLTMTGGVLYTAGLSEELGKFTLQGTAMIDLGAGQSILHFLDSSDGASIWEGTLTIANWTGSLTGGGMDQLFFGNTGAGLTSSQLEMITFLDPAGFEPGSYSAQMLPTGEVVAAVPEPGSLAALIGGIGVLGFRRFRSRFRA